MTPPTGGKSSWAFGRAGLIALAIAASWAAVSYIDLGDGATWTMRGRRGSGPLFQYVDARTEASKFAIVAVFRGVVPVVLIATVGGVLLLGAIGQRIQARS